MAMHEADGGNAMTEVALALAMAFFSISILALVSMGAGGATPQQVLETALAIDDNNNPEAKNPEEEQQAPAEPVYIFYWQGSYFDKDLQRTSPSAVANQDQAILVFPPDLPFETVMKIRQNAELQGSGQHPAIAQMSPEWITAFQNREQ